MSENKSAEGFYGYYVCFDATGVKEIDDVLYAVANACRASHHTNGWRDDHFNDGETCEKKIQDAANKSAATLAARESELAEAQRRVAELEAGINEGRLALRGFVDDAAFVKSDSVLVDSVMDVASFLAALLPPDRITTPEAKR